MKPFSEQDHYEALEIHRGATAEEIERAYRMALSTYAEDSLAGYSVFGEGDVAAMRERIELAYRTLSNDAARQAYDAELSNERAVAAALADAPELAESGARGGASPDPAGLDALDEFDEESGEFDGPRLRRVRLRQGIELEEIARVTKVNPTYLCFLEEERFGELPAAVYVRGFVMGYASCIGLDAHQVAGSYMKRYEEKRGSRKRSLFSRH